MQDKSGKYMVVGPLSTLSNWVAEFQRFAPDLPVLLYHGSQAVRGRVLKRNRKPVRVCGCFVKYKNKGGRVDTVRASASREGGSVCVYRMCVRGAGVVRGWSVWGVLGWSNILKRHWVSGWVGFSGAGRRHAC